MGIGLAHRWSRKSRGKSEQAPDLSRPEGEWIWHYCKDQLAQRPSGAACFFGHRHHPMELAVPRPDGSTAPYINLGDWIGHFTFGRFTEGTASLFPFD